MFDQIIGLLSGPGTDLERQRSRARRQQQRQHYDGSIQATEAHAAACHRRDLVVAVEATQRQHHCEQQGYRHQNHQITQTGQQRHLHQQIRRNLPLGGKIEHTRKAGRHHDNQQRRCHRQPGQRRLTQQIAAENHVERFIATGIESVRARFTEPRPDDYSEILERRRSKRIQLPILYILMDDLPYSLIYLSTPFRFHPSPSDAKAPESDALMVRILTISIQIIKTDQ